MSHETFCLDVRVGYHEPSREELIAFLKEKAGNLSLSAERGMYQGVKILRIFTKVGYGLQQFIAEEFRLGDDNGYEIHETSTDADRCLMYLPDFDSAYGYEKFPI